MNKFFYITYATGDKYLQKAEEIVPKLSNFFDESILYKKEDIDLEFYEKNKKILDSPKGAGYWLWKPYFLYKTLEKVNTGDIVFYLDLGDDLLKNIKNFVLNKIQINDGFFLIENTHGHLYWTKTDCFELMNCNEPKYLNSYQLEAGCCAFVKNDRTINFIKEWLSFCENYDIISDESVIQNHPDFAEHRYDQSILTNLQIKHDIKTVSVYEISDYIYYNRFF